MKTTLAVLLAFVGALTIKLGSIFWLGWFVWSMFQGGSFLSTFFVCAGWWVLTLIVGALSSGVAALVIESKRLSR